MEMPNGYMFMNGHRPYPISNGIPNSYPPNHNSSLHYEIKSYSVLSACKLKINELIPQPVTLPSNYKDVRPTEFNYNFALELETIAEIEEERKRRIKEREEEEKRQKERKLKAQAEAWKALEEKRKRKITSQQSKPSTNSDTLLDLNFDEQEEHHNAITPIVNRQPSGTEAQEFSFLSNPKNRQVFLRLSEMGLSVDAIRTGIEIVGADDDMKLINFIADYIKLEEQTEPAARPLIKQALLMHENKFQEALNFLLEVNKLSKNGNTNEQILEALSMFGNDITIASKFLIGYSVLKQLGFDDMKIREALVMSNNDSETALQYLLTL